MIMNYFELYDLPVTFNPDQAAVKRKFYALSKQYHPDFFIHETAEKQQEVLELATANNKAYKTLSDPSSLIQYVLSLKDLLKEGDHYVLPQSFLMEMMDVNEALMTLEFEPDPSALLALTTNVDEIEGELLAGIGKLTAGFEAAGEQEQQELLLKIKDLYYRKKYLTRIKKSIAKISGSTN